MERNFEFPLRINWNENTLREKFELKLKIRDFLFKVSGNNITYMLDYVLTKEENIKLITNFHNALKNFSFLNNSAKPKERYKFIRCLR
jgi:hypothetical protein